MILNVLINGRKREEVEKNNKKEGKAATAISGFSIS